MKKNSSKGENHYQSLLGQALAVPELQQQQVRRPSLSSPTLSPTVDPIIPRHSDFTVTTSNLRGDTFMLSSPPPEVLRSHSTADEANNNTRRRSILGNKVDQKYVTKYNQVMKQPQQQMQSSETPRASNATATLNHNNNNSNTLLAYNDNNHDDNDELVVHFHAHRQREMSDLTPPSSPNKHRLLPEMVISPLTPAPERHSLLSSSTTTKTKKAHETLHAQSLLLGLAFLTIWSPQNCMAPNLTEMATEFGFTTEAERDLYLGSNLALATGVLSLPLSAGIGILADLYCRKDLFVATAVGGALASLATGLSRNYQLLFVARLLNGGCMSGSVPVAFSLLGDLFHANERNAASSGLTAMMGAGIMAGQVYAGVVGSTWGWSHAFYVSSALTAICALLVWLLVQEPIRGGKEEVLQRMLKHGTRYERTLSWQGFCHALRNNESNVILLWQGFFSSVPWGIIFVFLNDYLSQERGFSVVDATYIVFMFGIGCAIGGIMGGYWGQVIQRWNRSYLPLFMALTTLGGIFPFVALLNSNFTNAHGFLAILYSLSGGCIASLPSVNVRPCLINVNPPETRGAALTAANLIINLARGAGPSCITLMGAIGRVNRQFSFNVTLVFFWTVSAIQLLFLAKTLPRDQDAMEAELALYAANQLELARNQGDSNHETNGVPDDDTTIVSVEGITSWDAGATRQTVQFMGNAFREIGDEFRFLQCSSKSRIEEEEEDENDDQENDESSRDVLMNMDDIEKRRLIWKQHQEYQSDDNVDLNGYPTEQTRLLPRVQQLFPT